ALVLWSFWSVERNLSDILVEASDTRLMRAVSVKEVIGLNHIIREFCAFIGNVTQSPRTQLKNWPHLFSLSHLPMPPRLEFTYDLIQKTWIILSAVFQVISFIERLVGLWQRRPFFRKALYYRFNAH